MHSAKSGERRAPLHSLDSLVADGHCTRIGDPRLCGNVGVSWCYGGGIGDVTILGFGLGMWMWMVRMRCWELGDGGSGKGELVDEYRCRRVIARKKRGQRREEDLPAGALNRKTVGHSHVPEAAATSEEPELSWFDPSIADIPSFADFQVDIHNRRRRVLFAVSESSSLRQRTQLLT